VNTLNFLRLVWPSEGLYLLSVPTSFVKDGETHKYHKHSCYPSIESAAAAASHLSETDGRDVFFALSTVREDFTHMNKAQRDAAGVKIRGGKNSDQTKAFWLDIDIGPDDASKYPSVPEALTALKSFIAQMGLPKPFITSSGGGIHVYWPLTQPLDASEWYKYAATLKALTVSAKLRADPSRTSDPASVLRPVGTFNWKTGTPRPVQVGVEGVVSDTDFMTGLIDRLKDQYAVSVPQQYVEPQSMLGAIPEHLRNLIPAVNINVDAAQGAGIAPPLASAVVKKCPQLLWQLQNPGAVSEPQWYAMIGCLRFAEKGHKGIHAMSQGYSGYSVDNVDSKIIQHENSGTGPTLCSTFEMHNPTLCAGCKYRGHIKTPLQAARELEAAPAPTVEVHDVATNAMVQVALPPPPHPFKRVKMREADACYIAMNMDSKDTGIDFDEVIYEFDIYPSKLVFDQRQDALCVVVCMWLPHEGWQERNIPAADFYDRRSLTRKLGDAGVMVDTGKVEVLTQYMVAYLRELQKCARAETVYAQLGWQDDDASFVLPDLVVRATGSTPIEPSTNIRNALNWIPPKGDLEGWKKIVAIFERPGMEGHQFAFGVGLAAPLFRFTNFNGAIVSVVGDRGTGKSSAALCANSIWGRPTMGWVNMERDTWKGFYAKIGTLNNLPVTHDEITNLDPERVSDLAYAITQGQGRQKLQQNGQAQENFGNWNTMLLSTSNASLHSRLSMAKGDASAEASRIFEYRVPPNTLTKEEADANFDQLNNHYGVAGEPFIRAVIQNMEKVHGRVREWIREVDKAAGVSSSERFWSAVPATILAAFEVSNEIGMTNVDIARLFAFSVRTIQGMRTTITDIVRTAESMVSDYINSNLRAMLVLQSEAAGTTLAQVSIHPSSDQLRIRLERHTGKLFFDRAHFRKFCQDRGMDVKQVQGELMSKNILLDPARKQTLGKGTQFSGAQTWCWLIDFNNPALSGSASIVGSVAAGTYIEPAGAVQ